MRGRVRGKKGVRIFAPKYDITANGFDGKDVTP